MKTIKGQLLMSTLEDSQGERRDKQFLEEIIAKMPARYPLGQHHDASLPNVGYIENFRLEELPEQAGEWCISGDVTMQDGQDWSKGGGFSFSSVEIVKRQTNGVGALYVPYPYYRDESALEEILSYDPQLNAGRWIKKGADPFTIGLIVTGVLWTLAPARDKLYQEVVWPFLDRVLEKYRKGRFKEMPFDYGSTAIGKNGEKINLLFIPDRRNSSGTFTKELVKYGLEKAMKLIAEDTKGTAVGIKQIKLYYHNPSEGYRVDSIQYADGTVTQLIGKQP
jgi:hypothetical protein